MFKYAMMIILTAVASDGCNDNVSEDSTNNNETQIEKKAIVEENNENTQEEKNISILHDIYALKSIEGVAVDKSSFVKGVPTIEMNISEMRISGFSGCNSFSGEIKSIENDSIQLGPIMSTKKFCQNVDESSFFKGLNQVNRYERKELDLLLFNNDNLIMTLKKVD